MNEIILELSALGIALFCLFDSIRNRASLYLPFPKGWVQKLQSQHYVYINLLLFLMISALSSVLEVTMGYVPALASAPALEVINEVYFIFHTALPPVFALYILNMTGTSHDRGKRFFVLFLTPALLVELLVLSNPFTKLIFYIDDTPVYVRGSLIWLIYATAALYLLAGVIFLIRNMRVISRHNRLATLILMLIAVIGIVIQAAFPIPVELFFEAISFFGFMLLLEDERYREMTGRYARMNKRFIAVIVLIFVAVVVMNINVIYHAGTDQMSRIGEVQTNSLKGELQQIISESESCVLRYSIGLEQLLQDSAHLDAVETYVREQKEYYSDLTDGHCFNVYAARPEWAVIPGFDFPDDFNAVERVWYTQAQDHPGQVCISEPYIDMDTRNLCITVSYMLSDGKTVVGMDYTLSSIQDIVDRMIDSNDQFAMIVTEQGTILGCSDGEFRGEELSLIMPEYTEVFERVKGSNEHRYFTTTVGGVRKIIFSSETSNGWFLILDVDYSSFYAQIYNQMLMLGAIDLLMVAVIIVFYMVSVNNQQKAERSLASTEVFISSLSQDLWNPLNEILRISDAYSGSDSVDAEVLSSVTDAGNRLREKMENLFSYSGILKAGELEEEDAESRNRSTSSRYMRNGIAGILIIALVIGLALCLGITTRWGEERLGRETDSYNSEVTMWIQQKQSILSMFANVISADSGVLDDYDRAVKWLDNIVKNYSEMTFAYMADPENSEHTVIMNNGWVPGDDFVLEERQWYIDTVNSPSGTGLSAPYFDAQTGLYCITFSRNVYSADGEFMGVFGIDCLMDKLTDVLADSYTPDSYAFMVDQDGIVINHPYKAYELSSDKEVNIEDTEYADVYHNGSDFWMRDYDGRIVACYAEKNSLSGFTVIVVQNWWSIYGAILVMSVIFLLMIVTSIIAVVRMINRFIAWQEQTNRQLVEAVDTAVAAEKAKSGFLAQMSHEIRTPINTVLGMNEMILRESSDASITEYASNIRLAGKNLLALINSILDFSKIEEGKMEIVPVRYETVDLIDTMTNSVSARAAQKGLAFEAHISDDLPSMLYGDDMRVAQVAVNLLTNAVKYTKEGRVDLYVDGVRKNDEVFSLRVKVKDTGIGIREEDIGRLFESFTRLEEKRNRNIEGTGLGMAIVNRLLDMMGSKLEVNSVYGKGSQFSFSVDQGIANASPVGDHAGKSKEAKQAADKDSKQKHLYAPDARLLVVDDNRMNQIVMEKLLEINGIRPDVAGSGPEALVKMKDNEYDIIMLDHMMPDMDGMETLAKAREDDLIAGSCVVIALTANAVVGARESYMEAGFDDYLSKPVEVSALEDALMRHLPKDKIRERDAKE